jgi:urea transporter/murein DD-endopeptidase MepM/ murein hydrolase activator NlpD
MQLNLKEKELWNYWIDAILNSYSQIFFSLNKLFASTILAVTFFNPSVGIFGLLAVFITNVLAYVFGFNRQEIKEGIYGFNALLLGLSLGFSYEVSGAFWLLFIIALFCLLVLTAVFKGTFSKANLPFLSFPFLICYWMISLAASELYEIHPRVLGLFEPNSGSLLTTLQHSLDQTELPVLLVTFFKTLAATFFIQSVLGGMLIAIALFLFSRISFSLAFLGFLSAFFVYGLFGANTNDLSANLVGSNYIFFAIAIGGFYLIPNAFSYLASILLVPVLMLLHIALEKLMLGLNLKTFTLAFSLLTTFFLYALHHRWLHRFLHLVTWQYYSAEKTVYKYLNSISRFNQAHLKKFALPFWGEWFVSQGYDGKITHLGEWSKALDFVIQDEDKKTYSATGIHLNDFYCYNKPVLAPADGYVYEITNHVEDNQIGEVDTTQNWGNSIVLNHLDGVFTQLSHIKKDSFKVSVGDFVSKGTILATCGSSGRSPEPHLHFQIQNSPKIGAKTVNYPLAYFLEVNDNKSLELKLYQVPKEGSVVANVEPSKLITQAFNWAPGKKLSFFKVEKQEVISWEVFTDEWNRLYLFEPKTHSYAYFICDGTRFYFTDFEGSKKSDLFHFYSACYSILMGAYPQIKMKDQLPLIHFNFPFLIWFQDVLSPFKLFTEVQYQSQISQMDPSISVQYIHIKSSVQAILLQQKLSSASYLIKLNTSGIQEIELQTRNGKERWICQN